MSNRHQRVFQPTMPEWRYMFKSNCHVHLPVPLRILGNLLPRFYSVEGDWYNEGNDKLTIIQTPTGMLLGDYSTNVELLTGMPAPTIVLGYASQDSPVPTFGFTVIRNNGASTTSWTGQCQICDRQEVLYTTLINTEAVTTCTEIKQATKIGQDKWTRYMQSQAPREDLP